MAGAMVTASKPAASICLKEVKDFIYFPVTSSLTVILETVCVVSAPLASVLRICTGYHCKDGASQISSCDEYEPGFGGRLKCQVTRRPILVSISSCPTSLKRNTVASVSSPTWISILPASWFTSPRPMAASWNGMLALSCAPGNQGTVAVLAEKVMVFCSALK